MLALNDGLYAIPASRVYAVHRISEADQKKMSGESAVNVDFNGQSCRRVHLADLLCLTDKRKTETSSLVFVSAAGETLALQVTEVPGHLEAIVKPLGQQVAALKIYSGACVQSNGIVVPVLDLNALVSTYFKGQEENGSEVSDNSVSIHPKDRLSVMVVDDSITMRKYAERALLRDNYQPMLARDGVEAMALMRQEKPDLILTDLEMPHMDGFELISMIRHDPLLEEVPVIVITSRSGEKHRLRTEKLGVQGFLAKPYQESELLEMINSVWNT